MSSDPDDPKNKPRHSSGNDPVEPSPFLLLCLLFHPFIPPILLLWLALSTPMLYPYPYLSIHSTLCDTHDSSQSSRCDARGVLCIHRSNKLRRTSSHSGPAIITARTSSTTGQNAESRPATTPSSGCAIYFSRRCRIDAREWAFRGTCISQGALAVYNTSEIRNHY